MNQFSSLEDPRVEERPPQAIAKLKPRSSPSRSSPRLRNSHRADLDRNNRLVALEQAASQPDQAFDAAIQKDLQDHLNRPLDPLAQRLAVLLCDTDGAVSISDLARVLEDVPWAEEMAAILQLPDGHDIDPQARLRSLAVFASKKDAVPNVAPLVAAISLLSLGHASQGAWLEHCADLVHTLSQASAELAENNGAEAMTVLPRILAVVNHHAKLNDLPAEKLAKTILRITRQVSSNADVVARLLKQPQARRSKESAPFSDQATQAVQRLVIDRPAEITIRYLS